MTEIRGSLYSPPRHRPSDDDVAEASEQIAACVDAVNDLRAVMTRAHLTLETYLGYTGIQTIADGLVFDKVLADLKRIADAVERRR